MWCLGGRARRATALQKQAGRSEEARGSLAHLADTRESWHRGWPCHLSGAPCGVWPPTLPTWTLSYPGAPRRLFGSGEVIGNASRRARGNLDRKATPKRQGAGTAAAPQSPPHCRRMPLSRPRLKCQLPGQRMWLAHPPLASKVQLKRRQWRWRWRLLWRWRGRRRVRRCENGRRRAAARQRAARQSPPPQEWPNVHEKEGS
mmetsp:Transcript_67484/g.133823  ORF Transcript_67484/g.133823 Transcript_67484/m.133823 type:complete len:202 (+) Transcript_67484:321-926(+)